MNKQTLKIRPPKGYSFHISKSYYGMVVHLLHGPTPVGYVDLDLDKDHGSYRTHSCLDASYRGQGLGVLLYAKAIQWALNHGHTVRSSGSPSKMAQRVWNSKGLRQYFTIKKVNRGVSYFYPFVWYAYPKGK